MFLSGLKLRLNLIMISEKTAMNIVVKDNFLKLMFNIQKMT